MAEILTPKILKVTQKIGWILLRPFLKLFTGYCLRSDCDIKKIKAPVIIVSNHLSHADSIFISTALPFNNKISPLYFMAVDRLMVRPIRGRLLKLLGAFRAYKKEGIEKSLAAPKEILKNGYSVVFYPEGHRFQIFDVSCGRPGASILAQATNVPILPIAILTTAGFNWKNFFLMKCRVKIKTGQPFILKDRLAQIQGAKDPITAGTTILMEEIKKLL